MAGSGKQKDLALLLAVVASGASGLTWEVLWQHHASLAFGVSSYGTAVTLAALMAGLGLGGLLAAELARRGRLQRPLVAYGVAELVVGAGALAVPPGLAAFSALDTALYLQAPAFAAATRLAGTVLVLLVPATAMGTTIPILASYVRRRMAPEARRPTVGIALVYACNLLGAVGGTLVATFLLLPLVGVSQTGWLTAAVNLAVAFWAIRRQRGEARAEALPAGKTAAPWPPAGSLSLAFLSGFTVFVLEVSWFRSLRAALQSTTESFALILAAFLVALTLGGALTARLEPRFPGALERLLPLAGLAVLLATPLVDSLDRWAVTFSGWVPAAFSPTIALGRLGLLLLAVGVPVTLLGMIFPWLLARHATAAGTGRLYAVNTAGAVSGALAAGFVLLPRIGSTRTSWLAGLAVLALAALVNRTPRARLAAAAAGLVGLAVAGQYGGHAASRRVQGTGSAAYEEILYVAEGPDSTVWVAHDRALGNLDLVIDGFTATSEAGAAHYMRWMGHLPALATPRLERALVICFGTGQTAHAVRRHRPGALEVVDVSAAVLRAAPHFKSNRGVLEDPAVTATVMDGRAFLRRRRDLRFDLVTLEPMPPNFAGSNNLYSREFYQLIKERLAPRGAVAQWVPFHILAPAHMMGIVRSFQEVFPYTRLWMDPVSTTGILVGAARPWELRPSRIGLPLSDREIEEAFVLDFDEVAALAADGPLITDDNQLLAYGLDRLTRADDEGLAWIEHANARNHFIVDRYRRESSPAP